MGQRRFVLRAALLGVVTVMLAVPPASLRALAQQQDKQQDSSQKKTPQDQQKKPEYQITVEAPLVNVDCVVTDQEGNIITGLKKENFHVLDDGVPQQVTNFSPSDAPITIVMMVEFSKLALGYFSSYAKYWGDEFLGHLKKDDWVALETFDLKSQIVTDFTQDKTEVDQAIRQLYFPGFSEANLFDALMDTLDRLQDVKGKKSILLLASGFDTFSKHTLDQAYKRLRQTDVTLFSVGVAETIYVKYGEDINYLQAKNQMSHMAEETGGYAWFPRFDGELPGIFEALTGFLRNQYTVSFAPSNQTKDGKFHKIKVEIVDDKGVPVVLTNKKGKKLKVVVYAREGYVAQKATVGD
jgi:VWFA-related protein